jgi:hypothetical protein
MDNRINEIRRQIRALRVSMLEAEAVMRDQINQDQECSVVAGEILTMRAAMSTLVGERASLGDREPILVNGFFIPRRPTAIKPANRPVKRHLVPPTDREGKVCRRTR